MKVQALLGDGGTSLVWSSKMAKGYNCFIRNAIDQQINFKTKWIKARDKSMTCFPGLIILIKYSLRF